MGVEFIFFRKVLKFVVTLWAKTYQKSGLVFFVIADFLGKFFFAKMSKIQFLPILTPKTAFSGAGISNKNVALIQANRMVYKTLHFEASCARGTLPGLLSNRKNSIGHNSRGFCPHPLKFWILACFYIP